MEQVVLTAQLKEESGKGVARKLRQQGLIPAILYGGGGKNSSLSLSLNYKDVLKIMKSDMGMGTVSQLDIQGLAEKQKRNVIFRDIQLHPVRHSILHVDLYEVAMDKNIQVEVPIALIGQAVGVKDQGGILEHHLRSLNVECLPGKIPGHIDVDISSLDLGKSIHAADLQLPDEVKVLDSPELLIASVIEPSKVEASVVAEAVEGEAAEGAASPAEESTADKS